MCFYQNNVCLKHAFTKVGKRCTFYDDPMMILLIILYRNIFLF